VSKDSKKKKKKNRKLTKPKASRNIRLDRVLATKAQMLEYEQLGSFVQKLQLLWHAVGSARLDQECSDQAAHHLQSNRAMVVRILNGKQSKKKKQQRKVQHGRSSI
jgi:hypothetical protein